MAAMIDAGIEAEAFNGAANAQLVTVHAALKETVLNLEHVAEEAERAARRARDRLNEFEGLFDLN